MAPRHRLYSPEIAETILERLADGEGLNAICQDDGLPSASAVRYWAATDHDGFAVRYTSARARGLEHIADEIVSIADTETDPNKARVRVDARKWVLSKLNPKVYGDKLDLNHSGEMTVKTMDDAALDARVLALAERAIKTDA